MEIIQREEIKKDPKLLLLKDYLMKGHQVADHTIKTLIPMAEVPDYCEKAVHFVVAELVTTTMYLSYEISTWIKTTESGYEFPVRLQNITIYDDQLEYENQRAINLNKN